MNISKSTINYATRRDVELLELDGEIHFTVNAEENECTSVVYRIDDEQLTFVKNFDNSLEDLPAHIGDEVKLKELIRYLAA
jgi:hypothetical protein